MGSIISIALLLGAYWVLDGRESRLMAERKTVICPSFLSIARSPRDTLIVMRNEPLCTEYVLENLQ